MAYGIDMFQSEKLYFSEAEISRRIPELLQKVENAPICYRAPKWPDPEFPRKISKKHPQARNSGVPEFVNLRVVIHY